MKKECTRRGQPSQKIDCGICGEEFYRYPSYVKRHKDVVLCCSNGCRQRLPRKSSKVLVSCSWCGQPIERWPYRMKARNHFCSLSCKGKWTAQNMVGSKAFNWKGGSYSTIARQLCNPRYRRIRVLVLALDGFRCTLCRSDRKLEAHHIIEKGKNPALIWDVTNMITLCKVCHCGIRGKEEIWIGYFSEIVAKRVKTGNSRPDNPVPSHLIANRQMEGVETKAEETIMPNSALPERDEIVQSS